MIIYRPIAPLTVGRSGLMSALAAMASTAVIGTSTWQRSGGPSNRTVPERPGNVSPAAKALAARKCCPDGTQLTTMPVDVIPGGTGN